MSEARTPLRFAAAGSTAPAERAGAALVLTRGGDAPPDAPVVRHAAAAARAQHGACACCRAPSDLIAVLRRLIVERASGTVDFAAVIVEGETATLAELAEQALADPVVAARYAVERP
jgi:hypothetical protein